MATSIFPPIVASIVAILILFFEETPTSNDSAQINLGKLYYAGQGVSQDYGQTVKWYRKAAEQGNAQAQTNLGVMYAEGQGVAQDYALGLMWWHIAASNGNQDALGYRDSVQKEMSPAQLDKAMEMARNCLSSNYNNCS